MFNPFFIHNNDQVTLQVLVRDLVHLGLYSIENECINGMIFEIQKLKDESIQCKNEFDLQRYEENKKHGTTKVL